MALSSSWDGSNVHEDHVEFLHRMRRLPGEDLVRVRRAPEREISPTLEEGANADLRVQLSEVQAALRAKETEYDALVLERDRLAKKLADQEESHKAALKKAQDSEDALKAEFETEAAGWAETRQALNEGFGRIEDLIDDYFPGYSTFAAQTIEAHREACC
ncbi:uncharacterized protein LOC125554860 [Triticum urartu]|uniref:uncharacterized protein LOC125554860 n=1 Tax=Triticum urartu TaxID=4572 RepID=UPI002043C04C|nr:uncharacterized protein LOC125554860 [Triticum urartu]